MRILHYLSGLPPVRGGGMIKYALDLIEAESKEHEVSLLIPGPIALKRRKRVNVRIKEDGFWRDLPVYKIYNPLPIPMCNGILDIDEFTRSCFDGEFEAFLQEVAPDVIHVHTFMGLHKEFMQKAGELAIPIIYTTHDYFGICPTANLFCGEKVCEKRGKACGECSINAFPEKRLILEQAMVYRAYRNSELLIRILQSGFWKKAFRGIRSRRDTPDNVDRTNPSAIVDYSNLLEYYSTMYEMITYFHFNSDIAKQVYEKYLGPLCGEVVHISNKSVCDGRVIHECGEKLKIGYLGGDASFKGMDRILGVVQKLYSLGMTDIELQVYGNVEPLEYPFCRFLGYYKEEERGNVFADIDILAVPSKWMETFGMVVLEALSYGVPVLVTDKVGAKELLAQGDASMGIILRDEEEAWEKCLQGLYKDRSLVNKLNRNICMANLDLKYTTHVDAIMRLYKAGIALKGKKC